MTLIFLGLFLGSSGFAYGEEKLPLLTRTWNYIKKDANVSAGVGARLFSLEVRAQNQNKILGKLIDGDDEAYFLTYSGRPVFLRQSHFGYRWMLNLSTFSANEQEIAKDQNQDLGTRIQGLFAYVVPTFFFNFGDRYKGRYFRMGLGLGLGTSIIDGDIQLNFSTNPNQKIALKNDKILNTAIGGFAEMRYSIFVLRLATAGPVIEMDNYKAQISDVSLMLGLSYFLD